MHYISDVEEVVVLAPEPVETGYDEDNEENTGKYPAEVVERRRNSSTSNSPDPE